MVEIVYYAAASLDGFIATPDGGIDWLPPIALDGEDYGYRDFYASVDAILMGSGTYENILRHAAWPYEGKPCWVFTRQRRYMKSGTADVTTAAMRPARSSIIASSSREMSGSCATRSRSGRRSCLARSMALPSISRIPPVTKPLREP